MLLRLLVFRDQEANEKDKEGEERAEAESNAPDAVQIGAVGGEEDHWHDGGELEALEKKKMLIFDRVIAHDPDLLGGGAVKLTSPMWVLVKMIKIKSRPFLRWAEDSAQATEPEGYSPPMPMPRKKRHTISAWICTSQDVNHHSPFSKEASK